MKEYRWRLRYPDHRYFDEPAEQLSIRAAPPGARSLVVLDQDKEIARLTLEDGAPIFYRVRYHENSHPELQRIQDLLAKGKPLTGALWVTVFGVAEEKNNQISTRLWMISNGALTPCADRFIDQAMIALQLEPLIKELA